MITIFKKMRGKIFLSIIIIIAAILCFWAVKGAIEKKDESGARDFAASYLEAYKDIATKKNFDDVKSFIFAEQNIQMIHDNTPIETNYTDFDNYEIVSVEKTKDGFAAKVKLSKGINSLKGPDGSDIFEIRIINENGELKSQTWYFAQ